MSEITTFPTPTRLHLSLGVRDVAASVRFYEVLFGQAPSKVKEDYAKWELLDPPANVSLVEYADATPIPGPQHFGIQVQSRERLAAGHQRLIDAGLATAPERGSCCYAEQEKVWVTDPDGHAWELFLVLGDTESLGRDMSSSCETDACGPAKVKQPVVTTAGGECCAPSCCE